jgi:hypothetical protein
MTQKNGKLFKEIKKWVSLNYLVYLPDNIEDAHNLPLVFFSTVWTNEGMIWIF